MSLSQTEELEQLKADLATLESADKIVVHDYGYSPIFLDELIRRRKAKIAELEAQPVDEWAEAKRAIVKHIQSGGHYVKAVAQYARHLEIKVAELDYELRCERADGGKVRDDLRARVADLEAKATEPSEDLESHLEGFRVLKTAIEIIEYTEKRLFSSQRILETVLCKNAVDAINQYVSHIRLWEGLPSLHPYKWSNIGSNDERLIDKQKEQDK